MEIPIPGMRNVVFLKYEKYQISCNSIKGKFTSINICSAKIRENIFEELMEGMKLLNSQPPKSPTLSLRGGC